MTPHRGRGAILKTPVPLFHNGPCRIVPMLRCIGVPRQVHAHGLEPRMAATEHKETTGLEHTRCFAIGLTQINHMIKRIRRECNVKAAIRKIAQVFGHAGGELDRHAQCSGKRPGVGQLHPRGTHTHVQFLRNCQGVLQDLTQLERQRDGILLPLQPISITRLPARSPNNLSSRSPGARGPQCSSSVAMRLSA